ncbi:MAG: hypothetical protein P4L40_04140 [Terracidiphilus sp.]|nr:hypothetical protein [Terracidiphilus sp.]
MCVAQELLAGKGRGCVDAWKQAVDIGRKKGVDSLTIMKCLSNLGLAFKVCVCVRLEVCDSLCV